MATEEGQKHTMCGQVCECTLVKLHCSLSTLPVVVPACHLLSVQIKDLGLIYSPVERMAELVLTTAS